MEAAEDWFEDRFLALLNPGKDPLFRKIARQLVRSSLNQHTCHSLAELTDAELTSLSNHPAVGGPGDGNPITLIGRNIYLTKFYKLETAVAEQLIARNIVLKHPRPGNLEEVIATTFGENTDSRQRLAALVCTTRQLAIITGGPGTGKTSTVMKILEVLGKIEPQLTINIAAPTGKAAMRLGQAVGEDFSNKVTTVHRLLGMRRDGRSYRHNADNPIETDLLIIDEASMVDLELMHRIMTAIPAEARLILLGDPNQLPSVDTGNVLADICSGDNGFSDDFIGLNESAGFDIPRSSEPHLLTNSIIELVTSHRFDPGSGIGKLAADLKDFSILDTDWEALANSSISIDTTYELPGLHTLWKAYFQQLTENQLAATDLIESFNTARVLCARRAGAFGVETVNRNYEQMLESMNLKTPGQDYYDGRPILVTRNDYRHELFNGDIGICRFDPSSGEYLAHFQTNKALNVKHLPEHETCFAMTVHKSQGSEFDHVVLVLDDDSTEESETLMTRELVYTAVTRAKNQFTAITTPDRWRTALSRRTRRVSGMAELLRCDTELTS